MYMFMRRPCKHFKESARERPKLAEQFRLLRASQHKLQLQQLNVLKVQHDPRNEDNEVCALLFITRHP